MIFEDAQRKGVEWQQWHLVTVSVVVFVVAHLNKRIEKQKVIPCQLKRPIHSLLNKTGAVTTLNLISKIAYYDGQMKNTNSSLTRSLFCF